MLGLGRGKGTRGTRLGVLRLSVLRLGVHWQSCLRIKQNAAQASSCSLPFFPRTYRASCCFPDSMRQTQTSLMEMNVVSYSGPPNIMNAARMLSAICRAIIDKGMFNAFKRLRSY